MPRFRSWPDGNQPPAAWPAAETVRSYISDAFRSEQFYIDDALSIEFSPRIDEEVYWELFQGRSLDGSQTRQRRRFFVWNAWDRTDQPPTQEPLLAVKWDREAAQVHVTRSILCRAWEAYSDQTGAIQSREVTKRIRELVGTIDLARMASALDFRDELIALLFFAVVGSRLPLTSVESPLPAFVLGQFAYCYRRDPENAASNLVDFIDQSLATEPAAIEKAKLLELAFRQADEKRADASAAAFLRRRCRTHSENDVNSVLRTLFNEISLSPYLGAVASALRFVRDLPPATAADFLSHLLRQTGRHLTAFDLVRFHYRGANYPDALLVDEVLSVLLERAVQSPESFLPLGGDHDDVARAKRLRRRGLRQGWLIRQIYRGHAVPDAPTSPGENARVWPATIPHVSEDQILNVGKRHRHLFDTNLDVLDSDNVLTILHVAIDDLTHPSELRELGTALFLDRPFGIGKRPTEPDRTLLFSYIAFSRNIARDRLRTLAAENHRDSAWLEALEARLQSSEFDGGIRFAPARPAQRPGSACLEDALLAADDFVFLRSTRRSVEEFLRWYDVTPIAGLRELLTGGPCLMLRSEARPDELVVYDANWNRRFALKIDVSEGFISRIGVEQPAAGLVAGDVRIRSDACGLFRHSRQ